MLTPFFTDRAGHATMPARKAPTAWRYGRFFHAMLEHGVYLPPVGVRGRLHVGGARRGGDGGARAGVGPGVWLPEPEGTKDLRKVHEEPAS